MDGACPVSSDYMPSSLVSSFHSIPHVDIDLNASQDSFEISVNYFQAIIIWAFVPILCIVCLFILMAVYFICVCCCCCVQQHDKRSRGSKGVCGSFVIFLVLLCLAMVGVALWAEYELDQNVIQSVNAARNAADITDQLQNVSNSSTYDMGGIETDLINLRNGLPSPSGSQQSADNLIVINRYLGMDIFPQLKAQIAPISLGNVDALFTSIDFIELTRHWVVIAYLIVTALLLILVAVSVCCSACCASPVCMILMLVVFIFVTFVMWVAVGANLALLVVSGDICFEPDNLIRNITINEPDVTVTPELLDYYLICQDTCYPSPFQLYFDNTSMTIMNVMTNEAAIQSYLDTTSNPALQSLQDSVVLSFSGAEEVVLNIEGLTNCTGINDEYLAVFNNLCDEGYLYSVILFGMACGMAVVMVLIMICGSFYAGLLSEGRVYDDETIVYDFPHSGNSPWDAYGTNQHYTHTESFNMGTSPQPGGSDPPKYTDLTHAFNGEGGTEVNVRNSNGFGNSERVSNIRYSNVDIDLGEPLEP